MIHDEGVAVFAAAQVYAHERMLGPCPSMQRIDDARRHLARACGLPDTWGDSDEAMAALGVAQVNALYPVEEGVTG